VSHSLEFNTEQAALILRQFQALAQMPSLGRNLGDAGKSFRFGAY
jgi:hypothetical protein